MPLPFLPAAPTGIKGPYQYYALAQGTKSATRVQWQRTLHQVVPMFYLCPRRILTKETTTAVCVAQVLYR
jgi:hypothetical protein